MADFALWVAACETTFCRAGNFERAYWWNRRAAVEDVVDADPVAAGIRDFMSEREGWTGSASDLLRALDGRRQAVGEASSPGWPRSPRALAGRLRRAQTFLRTLGLEITFRREGQLGARIIRVIAPRQDPCRSTGTKPSASSVLTATPSRERTLTDDADDTDARANPPIV